MSLPIGMISCAWKDWFEAFRSLKKGMEIYSLNALLSGSLLFSSPVIISNQIYISRKKPCMGHAALGQHKGMIGG
jgi:hypothetical protein